MLIPRFFYVIFSNIHSLVNLNIRYPTVLLFSILLYAAITRFASAEEYQATATILPQSLGYGFNQETMQLQQPCLSGTLIEHGNHQASLNFLGNFGATELIEQTYGKVKGGVNIIIFSGSVSTSVTSKVTHNNKEAASTLKLTYHNKDVTLENRQLTPLGQQALAEGPLATQAQCGDAFIHHLKLGSNLYVTAKWHFQSEEDYKKWVNRIKIRLLFYTKKKKKIDEETLYAENGVYSIQVHSDYPLPERLKKMLQQETLYCTKHTMTDCINASDRIFSYLFSQEGYLEDLKTLPPNILSFTTLPYVKAGHFEFDGNSGPDRIPLALASEQLNLHLIANQQRLESVTAFAAVETDPDHKKALQQKIAQYQNNIKMLDQAAQDCQQNPELTSCQQAVNLAIKQLNPSVLDD